jgi:glutamyl-Q tRNA(Asp) synthetase
LISVPQIQLYGAHTTARQVLLQRALGLPTPRYLHFPVAADANGEKLSKQTLARPVHASEASARIGEALAFLGQASVATAKPARMLAEALEKWDVDAIPKGLWRATPGV